MDNCPIIFFQKAALSFATHTTSFAPKGWRVFQFLAARSYVVSVILKYKSFVTRKRKLMFYLMNYAII